jgi:hypothetical protein
MDDTGVGDPGHHREGKRRKMRGRQQDTAAFNSNVILGAGAAGILVELTRVLGVLRAAAAHELETCLRLCRLD